MIFLANKAAIKWHYNTKQQTAYLQEKNIEKKLS